MDGQTLLYRSCRDARTYLIGQESRETFRTWTDMWDSRDLLPSYFRVFLLFSFLLFSSVCCRRWFSVWDSTKFIKLTFPPRPPPPPLHPSRLLPNPKLLYIFCQNHPLMRTTTTTTAAESTAPAASAVTTAEVTTKRGTTLAVKKAKMASSLNAKMQTHFVIW